MFVSNVLNYCIFHLRTSSTSDKSVEKSLGKQKSKQKNIKQPPTNKTVCSYVCMQIFCLYILELKLFDCFRYAQIT